MAFVALIPLLAFVIVDSAVAIRLLRLGMRTRKLPELSLGLGMALICGLGMPLCVLGRLPATVGTPGGTVAFAIGAAIVAAGIQLLFVFTWSVFRRGSRWGNAALAAAAVALAAISVGLGHAGSAGTSIQEILPRTRPYAIGLVLLVMLAFAWTAIESGLYFHKLRRRARIGLADPVLVDRFRLWALGAGATSLLCAAITGFIVQGVVVLRESGPLSVMAVMGVVMCVAWTLTFMPPEGYRRFVERRASSPR